MSFYGNAAAIYLVAGLVILIGGVLILAPRLSVRSFTHPVLGFTLTFTAYHCFAPVGPLLTATHLYEPLYKEETPKHALLLYLLFYFSTLLTYYSFARREGDIPEINRWQLPKVSAHIAVSAFLGLFAVLALARQLMVIAEVGINEFLINRVSIQAGNQQFLLPLNFFAVISLCSFGYAMAAKSQGLKSAVAGHIAWVTMLLAMVAGFSTGSRTRALYGVLLVCIAYLMLSDPVKRGRRLLVAGGFALAALGGFALQGVRADLMSRIEREVAVESGTVGDSVLRSFPEYENTWWLLEHENEYEDTNGATIFAALTIPIPREIWNDKPYGGAVMLKNLIRPGSYNPNSGLPIGAYTTGIVAEGLLAFGQIGVIVSGIIMGLLLRFVNFLRLNIASPYDFAMWIICYYRIVELQRSEFMGGVAYTAYAILGLLIMRQWAMSGVRRTSLLEPMGQRVPS